MQLTDTTISSGTISNTSKTPSIFNKKNKTQNTIDETKILQKVGEEQGKLSTKYNIGNNYKKVENIEKALKMSKVPGLSGVPSFAKIEIKSIGEDIKNILGSIAEKTADCKTEAEIKKVMKDIEVELQQKKHIANVLLQRSQKAQELDKTLSKIYSDPQKAKLAEKIDISKIIDKLTSPVEEVNVEDIKEQENVDDKSKDKTITEKFNEALKNDEISNVVESLIKYFNKGEKDKILDNYMKNYDTGSNNTDKKKNPFG